MSICLTSGCVRIWTERRWHIAILRQSPGSTPEHSLTLCSLRADYTWANVMRGLIIVEHRMCGPSSDIDSGLITLGKLLTNGYKSPRCPRVLHFLPAEAVCAYVQVWSCHQCIWQSCKSCPVAHMNPRRPGHAAAMSNHRKICWECPQLMWRTFGCVVPSHQWTMHMQENSIFPVPVWTWAESEECS